MTGMLCIMVMRSDSETTWIGTSEAAQLLGVSQRIVRSLCDVHDSPLRTRRRPLRSGLTEGVDGRALPGNREIDRASALALRARWEAEGMS